MNFKLEYLFWGFVLSLSSILPHFIVGVSVDEFQKEVSQPAIQLAFFAAVLYIIFALLRSTYDITLLNFNSSRRYSTKKRLLHALIENGIEKFYSNNAEEIIDRIDGDVDATTYISYQYYVDLITNSFTIMGSMILVAYFSPYLTTILISSGLISISLVHLANKKQYHDFSAYLTLNSRFIGQAISCRDKDPSDFKLDLNKLGKEVVSESLRVQSVNIICNNLGSISYLVGLALLYIIGSIFVNKELVSIGGIVSVFLMIERFNISSAMLISIFFSGREPKARQKRIIEFIGEKNA